MINQKFNMNYSEKKKIRNLYKFILKIYNDYNKKIKRSINKRQINSQVEKYL